MVGTLWSGLLFVFLLQAIICPVNAVGQKISDEDEVFGDAQEAISNIPKVNLGSFTIVVPPERGLKIISVSGKDILRLDVSYCEGQCKLAGIQVRFYPDSYYLKAGNGNLNTFANIQMIESNGRLVDNESIYRNVSNLTRNDGQLSKTICFKKYSGSSVGNGVEDVFNEDELFFLIVDIFLTPLTGYYIYPSMPNSVGFSKDDIDSKWLGYVISNYQVVNSLAENGIVNVVLQTYLSSDKLVHIMNYMITSIRTPQNRDIPIDVYKMYDDVICSIVLSTGETAKGYIDTIDDRYVVYRKSRQSNKINLVKKYVKMIVCGKDTSFISK
jgi:hypothetical protein